MTLADWLEQSGLTRRAFGGLVGVTQGRISQIVSGETPSLELAVAIEDVTRGDVTVRELLKSKILSAKRYAAQDRA